MPSEPAAPPPRVWAVTAAYRRAASLQRLLSSLATERPLLQGAIVVDNGGDPATARGLQHAPVPVRVLTPGRNLGCGGGVAAALGEGLTGTAATHFWQLDDDASVRPGALAALLEALAGAGADAASPLVVNEEDRVCWFPGPLPRAGWRALGREVVTAAGFRTRFGGAPLAWSWSPWTSLLLTRRAVEAAGLPRDDYWFQGEDIEYTLRISARFRAVLAPGAVCVHHAATPPGGRPAFLKRCALLQNNAFTFTHLPHGRRGRRHLPGNFGRFLREERFAPAAWAAAGCAFWRGAVRGRPAGTAGCDGFRREWEEIAAQTGG